MIERYSIPPMSNIWTNEEKIRCWLRIELFALHAMLKCGIIPNDTQIPNIHITENDGETFIIKGNVNGLTANIFIPTLIEQWLEEEKNTHHDVVAFIHVLEQNLGVKSARYIHYGMTSSDLCDTEFALRIKEGLNIIHTALMNFQMTILEKADHYKKTAIMGRTHGMLAEPTTFGIKLLTYVEELNRHSARLTELKPRILVGKLSGAVGTYAHLTPEVEKILMEELGLEIEPVASQIVHRDRHAEMFTLFAMIGSTIERLATEIRSLSRSEIDEVSEAFGKKQKGSSAMPHKRNPIKCETITGLARMLRGYSVSALENITLWHERDISHSSVERFIAPDAFGILYYMLQGMYTIINGLEVNKAGMMERVVRSKPLWTSQMAMLAEIRKGLSRKEAHDKVQSGKPTFIMNNPLEHHLRHVDEIFERIKPWHS
ncbi:adenylosuccinate lyase [Candidatus Pacearchaeota archaeon]|nr:adenylosuccinate lyase [Candidatus Pacearchaeota archaeon]